MKLKDCLETLCGLKDYPYIFFFDYLDEAKKWMESSGTSGSPLFVLKTGIGRVNAYLKEELCEARVTQVFAIREDRFVIVLNDEE